MELPCTQHILAQYRGSCPQCMDDQAWREAMETEQLSCIDPVPGYIPPPSIDDDHYLGPSS